jgi:hypothetical protein
MEASLMPILITHVKNNQQSLLQQVEHGTKIQVPMLKKWETEWPYIREVLRVTRQRDGKVSINYYVSNGELTAQGFGRYIRRLVKEQRNN